MSAWSNGVETIQVPDGVPTGHLASLGWKPVVSAPDRPMPGEPATPAARNRGGRPRKTTPEAGGA